MGYTSLKHRITLPLLLFIFMGICAFSQSTQDSLDLIKKYHFEGREMVKSQHYEEAMVNLVKAYKLANSRSFIEERLKIHFSIAQLNYNLQNYEMAAKEVRSILNQIKDSDKFLEIAEANTLLGLIYTQLGKLEEAEISLRKADHWFTSQNDEKNRANVLLGLGILELKRSNFKTAINYFNAAIPTFKASQVFYQEGLSQLNKTEALIKVNPNAIDNSIGKAKESLKAVKEIANAHRFSKLQIESYRLASYIALRENNYSLAEESMAIYERKNDSLYQVFLKAISAGTNTESDVVNLNEIIDKQQSDLDKQQKSINFGKMTTGLSIALIVILSLLTLSLYKNNNLRAKANELLQDKNNELQLAKEKAEKASLAKAQFLSTITHELRTPLYAVTGLTHLLLEEDPKPDQKEHLNSLKFSGEYLLSLINNILDLNKLEANKVEVEKTSFHLKKRINDVLIALKKSADDRKNNIHFEFDESIPEKLVGDPLKLSQILINLIGNSLKFTQNGDVFIRVKKVKEDHNKVLLHFEIEDNGVGISKKKQKSIFESFSQASLQINRKFGGTGLGLAIVKNLLELMGSRIQLESQLGKGSRFWFDINFNVSEEVNENQGQRNVAIEIDFAALENRKVLVVEDNKINQMITKKILEKNKMVCTVADNGMDAIKLVQDNNFDVVLMDIHMPGISGIEATQEIRKFDKQLPIIALTAVTIDENLDDFYRAGFNEIIPKPFKTEEFFEKIYRTLENRKITIEG